MKAILASITFAGLCLAFLGCESDLPPSPESRFEHGVIGEGQIVQPDKSEDPLIKENTRVGY